MLFGLLSFAFLIDFGNPFDVLVVPLLLRPLRQGFLLWVAINSPKRFYFSVCRASSTAYLQPSTLSA